MYIIMKKIAFTVISLFAIGSTAFSQDARNFGWGVKAGLNVSSISKISADAKAGFTAGLFADYRFNDWFGASVDLLFSRQGAKYKQGDEITMKTNYLNIPILANFYVWNDLAFKIGIQPSIFLSAKNKGTIDGQDVTVSTSDGYKGADFAFPIGLSYEFFHKLILDARYNIGVANVFKGDVMDGLKAKNNYFTISVGYRF